MTKNLITKHIAIVAIAIISCFSYSSCNDDTQQPTTPTYAYMNVNWNGTDYTGLNRSVFGATQQSTDVHSTSSGDKYLHLQGSHSDIEVNIRLRGDAWKTGTYTLEESASLNNSNEALIGFIVGLDGDYDVQGNITVTEFDLVNRRIKANFDFSSANNTVTGTLDYPLDDDEFL
ncbi:MAG: hypothetical protein AB8G11_16895 [Saprospiraceae bacterium]